MTLIEMTVSVAVFATLSAGVAGFFITGMRMAGGVIRENLMSGAGRSPVEEIKNSVRTGTALKVLNNGTRLEITRPDGTVSAYYYQTGGTAAYPDNAIMYLPAAGFPAERVTHFISPVGGNAPVFRQSGLNTVTIQLRIGDPLNAAPDGTGRRDHAVDVLTTVCLRNNPT